MDFEEIVQCPSHCDNFSNFSNLLSSISKKNPQLSPKTVSEVLENVSESSVGGGLMLHRACSLNCTGESVCSSHEALWCAASEVRVYTLLRHALLWSPPAAPPPPSHHSAAPPLASAVPLNRTGSKNTHTRVWPERKREQNTGLVDR